MKNTKTLIIGSHNHTSSCSLEKLINNIIADSEKEVLSIQKEIFIETTKQAWKSKSGKIIRK